MSWIRVTTPTGTQTPSIGQHKEATPQVGKTLYATFSTIVKDVATTLKITGLWIAQPFNRLADKLTGSTTGVIQRHSIEHNMKDLNGPVNSFVIKNLLVESRNMIARDQFKTAENRSNFINEINAMGGRHAVTNDETELKKFIASNPKDAKLLKKIEEKTRGGVCAGACIDFASKLLEHPDLGKADLMSIAQHYKSGIPAAGVANQIAYAQFSQPLTVTVDIATVDMTLSKGNLSKEEANSIKDILTGSLAPKKALILKEKQKLFLESDQITNKNSSIKKEFKEVKEELIKLDKESKNFEQQSVALKEKLINLHSKNEELNKQAAQLNVRFTEIKKKKKA